MEKVTESESIYDGIEKMTTRQLLESINAEDRKVPAAVAEELNSVERLVDAVTDRLLAGGRLFYIGAGTSGRLGIVDASECPPTFGVPHDLVIGIIAGGDKAIRRAEEFAEDDPDRGWNDLQEHRISKNDFVVGIAASGTTPYVVGALEKARKYGSGTGCITCNPGSPVAQNSDFPVEVNVGPEFVTGSTRMKSGTAQKLVLNMLSTGVMVKLGRVKGNRMVDMQLSNNKLVKRGAKMVQDELNINFEDAKRLLLTHGSVRKAVESKK